MLIGSWGKGLKSHRQAWGEATSTCLDKRRKRKEKRKGDEHLPRVKEGGQGGAFSKNI